MSRIFELYLRVREADEADFEQPIVRIHEDGKPQDIRWNDSVNLSLDRKNWITCKLKPAGDIGSGKMYIGIHLRGLLNKDASVIQIAKVGSPCNFYMRKASYLKALLYVTIGITAIIAITFLVSRLVS